MQEQSSPRRLDWLPITLVALALICAAWQTLAGYAYSWGIDDAYISYRYAQNFAAGHGLVYNPGEFVEGYSNLLYVLLMVPAFWLTEGLGVFLYSLALNMVFLAMAVLLVIRQARRGLGDQAPAAALLFVLCPALWLWCSSGMETILVLLIQLAIWEQTETVAESPTRQRLLRLVLLLLLSLVSRTDGFVVPLIAIGYLALRGHGRMALVCALVVAGGMATYMLWRYAYYGYPLSNTYYVKVSGPLVDRLGYGIELLGRLALEQGLLPYLLVALVVLTRWLAMLLGNWRAAQQELRFDLVFIPGWLAYWIAIGGDNFFERFLLPLFPIGCILLYRTLGRKLQRPLLVAVTLVLVALQLRVLWLDERFEYSGLGYDRWLLLGNYLGTTYPGATLAIDAAGKVPFFSQLYTIDMLGLNDRHIAHLPAQFFYVGHNKFDPDYVLARKPDLIAAWVFPNFDFTWGMTRDKYLPAGYRLGYLISEHTPREGLGIIDVRGLDPASVAEIRGRGYIYGVLIRETLAR